MILASLRNPYLVIVTCLSILVLGGFAYLRMPADLLPQFNTSAVQIVCFYPGMPPEVMEKDIMSRLQRWTGQSVGIEHQEAKAMQGVCVVKDFFNEGVSLDTATSQVSMYAMSDMFYLPPGTIPPMVMPFDPTASVPLCLVVVDNPAMNEQELYDIAYYELRNKLQSIQGVIAPAVYGGKLRRILAYVRPRDLESHNMSLMDVQRELMKQNVLIPAGSIKDGNQEIQIFTNANVDKVSDLNEMMITNGNGELIYLSEVADVKNTSQIQTNVVRVNGSRKAYIPIYRQPGANTIDIVNQIKNQLSIIEDRLKVESGGTDKAEKMQTLTLSVRMDQSLGVKKGNRGLQIAALLGALLAGLVVYVFLRSFRLTLIVVLAIPLAILCSIFVMFLANRFGWPQSINAMTLGGLALAIGVLVDQSIVVLENIGRHAQMDKTPLQAAYDGTREVARPMLVATITFVIVFVPVVFLSGMAKFLFTPLALAAGVAIFASYFLSITLVPAYCSKFLRPGSVHEEHMSGYANGFGRFLEKLLKARFAVVMAALVLFAVSCFAFATFMGRELFPQVDAGQITMLVRMPTGTNLEASEEEIIKIEKAVQEVMGETADENGDLSLLVSNIGVLLDWPAAYTPNSGAMDAFMLLQTRGKKSVFDYVTELRARLNKEFPGVEFAFDTGGMMTAALNMGEPSPIHFQIQSSVLETGQDIGEQIIQIAENVPGTADARIAQRIDYPVVNVVIDREKVKDYGLTVDEVMKNLISATNSSINFQPAFWIDKRKGNHYFLGVQYQEDELKDIDALRDIPIRGGPGGTVRLSQVLRELKFEEAPFVINHRNISRVTDVYINVLPGYDIGSVVSKIETKLQKRGANAQTDERGQLYRLGLVTPKDDGHEEMWNAQPLTNSELYKGRTIRMMGEVKTMRESFSQFSIGLAIAAILVYLVMVAQFQSFVDPLIVLLTVPLGFVGVVVILLLTGSNISIMAFMGIIMMVGIVVEYSIVLVDFANRLVREQQLTPMKAIVEAAKTRLRPILMTSFTTWLAMLPMAIGFGGATANVPLARAIIGGVIGATVLSLIVVPCLYVMMKRTGPARQSFDVTIETNK